MVTTEKRRIREAPEPSGMIGRNQAAKKYRIDATLISRWVQKGEVHVAKEAAFKGDTVLLDEASLRKRLQDYAPHKDNSARRRRSKTIGELQAEKAQASLPSHAEGRSVSSAVKGSGYARPSAPAQNLGLIPAGTLFSHLPLGVVPRLDAKGWVDLYYQEQARRHGRAQQFVDGRTREQGQVWQLRPQTKESYDWVFNRYLKQFRTIPLDRKTILDYIHGLQDLKKGGPLGGGSKMLIHRQLSSFYNWLDREYEYRKPNLTNHGIVNRRPNALPLAIGEIRALRHQIRGRSEYTILLLLAQTGMRIGELCTIRPETTHDHWVEVWGKITKINPTGWRQVPLPDECYDYLLQMYDTHGELVWVNTYGLANPLAGPIKRATPGRAVNLNEESSRFSPPQTYLVEPLEGSVKRMQDLMRQLMKWAGIHEPGKGPHSFRRAYQAEFVLNGGNRDFYRLIMGHFQSTNMDDLYTHTGIAEIVDQARKFAPRRFLQEEATQGEMELDQAARAMASEDEEGDEE